MRVVEIETQEHKVRYVVMDEEGKLVGPIVQYLKYLDRIGSARNTLRSYAAALRLYWEFLSQEQLDWQQITLDDLSRFVLWLKLPSGSIKVLPAHPVEQVRSNRTINHTLTVIRGFYDYQWRMEEVSTNLKDKTTTSLPGRFRRYKGFLHHITKGSPIAKNILKQCEKHPRTPLCASRHCLLRRFSAGARDFSLGSERLRPSKTGRRKICKDPKSHGEVFGTFFDLLLATIPFCLYSAHTFFPRYRGIHFVSQSYSRSTRREKPFSAYLQSFGDLNGIALLSRTY